MSPFVLASLTLPFSDVWPFRLRIKESRAIAHAIVVADVLASLLGDLQEFCDDIRVFRRDIRGLTNVALQIEKHRLADFNYVFWVDVSGPVFDPRWSSWAWKMESQIGVEVQFAPASVYTASGVNHFIAEVKSAPPDAVLIVNFWNTFSGWAFKITQEVGVPAIVYHSVGSNHQLPPQKLMKAEGVYYIHSIENWEEIDCALRAVHAKKMLAQSRVLRVGDYRAVNESTDAHTGVKVVEVPAAEYNSRFDALVIDDRLRGQAVEYRNRATEVMDVTDHYIAESLRAHQAVNQLLRHYGGDAVTIKCLMLEERKPCVSFSINNGDLVPCGCEDDYFATLSLILGRWLLQRGGFQHNPEFDTSRNQYFGAHCTCATKLMGPAGDAQPYMIRPFFHQLPKTAALDVQWAPDSPVILTKLTHDLLHCWTGVVEGSPQCPPAGGCATRVLVNIDRVDDICSVYPGPHPVLFRGTPEEARRFRAFAKLTKTAIQGNV